MSTKTLSEHLALKLRDVQNQLLAQAGSFQEAQKVYNEVKQAVTESLVSSRSKFQVPLMILFLSLSSFCQLRHKLFFWGYLGVACCGINFVSMKWFADWKANKSSAELLRPAVRGSEGKAKRAANLERGCRDTWVKQKQWQEAYSRYPPCRQWIEVICKYRRGYKHLLTTETETQSLLLAFGQTVSRSFVLWTALKDTSSQYSFGLSSANKFQANKISTSISKRFRKDWHPCRAKAIRSRVLHVGIGSSGRK